MTAFSVVMATFGRGELVAPSIESVMGQSLDDWELLVVGDGCADETEETVRNMGDARVRWVNLARNSGGQSAPNNEGVRRARSDWVCYLGHDDIWSPDHLEGVADRARATPAVDIVASGCVGYGPAGSETDWVTGPLDESDTDSPLHYFIPPSALAHRRALLERIGEWARPEDVPGPVDADLQIRAVEAGCRFGDTGRFTVHKFTAGDRYLAYLRPSAGEQTSMLARLRAGRGDPTEVVVRAQRIGRFILMPPEAVHRRSPGATFARTRRQKGLVRPPRRALEHRWVIAQDDGPRALDWHDLETGAAKPIRWSGPSPRPRILLPFTGGAARVEIELAGMRDPARATAIGLAAEEQPVEVRVEHTPDAPLRLVADIRLAGDDDTILTLHTPDMFCPAELGESVDSRRLGVAVADVILTPR